MAAGKNDQLTVTFTEEFDPRIARYIVDNSVSLGIHQDHAAEFAHYVCKSINGRRCIKFSRLGAKHGRLYSHGFSLQRAWHPIVHTLLGSTCHDIDIVNCHIVLLDGYLKRNAIPVPATLTRLVQDREVMLNDLMVASSVSRDEAKNQICRLIYGGKVVLAQGPGWLFDFRDEIRVVIKQVASLQENKELRKLKSLVDGAKGRSDVLDDSHSKSDMKEAAGIAAMRMFAEEDACLKSIIKTFIGAGFTVMFPHFDGMKVKRRDGIDPSSALRLAEAAVLASTGYSIRLVEKPMDQGFNIADEALTVYADTTMIEAPVDRFCSQYLNRLLHAGLDDEAHAYVNRWFTCVMDLRQMEVVELERSLNGRRIINHISCQDYEVKKKYAECVIPGVMKEQPRDFFDVWLKSENRSKNTTYTYTADPLNVKNGQLNLFPGFRADVDNDLVGREINMAPVTIITDHIRDVLCGEDAVMFDFVMKWLALPLQRPGTKCKCALVVIGGQGIGKSVIFEDLMKLIYGGDDWVAHGSFHLNENAAEITKFNAPVCRRHFINADEPAAKAGFYTQQNRLKGLVTRTTISEERKGLEARTLIDEANWVFTSNDENIVRVESDDRRYAILDPARIRPPKEAIVALRDAVFSGSVDFYQYLMGKVDITGFTPWDPTTLPATSKRLAMILDNIDPEIAFIQSLVETGFVSLMTFNQQAEGRLTFTAVEQGAPRDIAGWSGKIENAILEDVWVKYAELHNYGDKMGQHPLKSLKGVVASKIGVCFEDGGATAWSSRMNQSVRWTKFADTDTIRDAMKAKSLWDDR